MKKNIKWLFLFVCIVLLMIRYNNFDSYIQIITKNEETNKISYYKVNNLRNKKKVKKFNSDSIEFYYFDDCNNDLTSDDNSFIKTCNIVNENGEQISLNKTFLNLLEKMSNKEHSIINSASKIIKINNDYFVVIALNVNWHSPYELYYYNKNNNKLKLIYDFTNEDVIGINIENKEFLKRYDKINIFILIILIFIIGYTYADRRLLLLPNGKYLYSIISPNKKEEINVYMIDKGIFFANAIRVQLASSNKNIYYKQTTDSIDIKWLDNDNILINDKIKLNVYKNKYYDR